MDRVTSRVGTTQARSSRIVTSAIKDSRAKTKQAKVDKQHTAILEMGVSIWNQWRASEPLTVPNLQNANLSGLALENVNLARANLRGANLQQTYLYDADFQEADLRGATLDRAVLIGANFCKANLADATLEHAYLAQSDLSRTNLTGACLQFADLQSALMTKAILANARLADAEMSESFGLTPRQIQSAADSHLASLQEAIRGLLRSTTVAPENGVSQEAIDQGSKKEQAVTQPSTQSLNAKSTAQRPAKKIFRPQQDPAPTQDVAHPLEPRFQRLAV